VDIPPSHLHLIRTTWNPSWAFLHFTTAQKGQHVRNLKHPTHPCTTRFHQPSHVKHYNYHYYHLREYLLFTRGKRDMRTQHDTYTLDGFPIYTLAFLDDDKVILGGGGGQGRSGVKNKLVSLFSSRWCMHPSKIYH
jgi:hypothetical protein